MNAKDLLVHGHVLVEVNSVIIKRSLKLMNKER
jgi:hypothetical protein